MQNNQAKLTVLNTRAKHQASKFSRALLARGHQVIEFPCILIQRLEHERQLLRPRDLLVFTSTNAVENFSFEGSPGLVACVGPATAVVAEKLGLKSSLLPKGYNSRVLGQEIIAAVKLNPELTRILLVTVEKPSFDLAGALATAGLHCEIVATYRAIRPEYSNAELLEVERQLKQASELAVVTFFSAASLRNFAQIMSRVGSWGAYRAVPVCVIGGSTSKLASALGFTVVNQAAENTEESLLELLDSTFPSQAT